MIEKLTIEELSPGFFLVTNGGKFAANLTKDEVLGVVASAMFSPGGPVFLRSYEEEVEMQYMPAGVAYRQGPHLSLPGVRP